MKKVILNVAALLFAVGIYAQHATPPPPLTAVPSQSLASGANTGESIQNGNDNKVRVQQAGTSQSVYSNQNDGTGTGGNQAFVRQTGNVTGASGVANLAEVLQSGSVNMSTTLQEGDRNEASTRQGQSNTASSGNRAIIRQGTGQNAEDNLARIDQDGDNNIANTRQTYDNSHAWTKQVGDDNKSRINQNAGPNQTDGHGAEVNQIGDRNESWVQQSGNGASNNAKADQVGDDNQAIQTQVNTSLADGGHDGISGNEALVSQLAPGGNQGVITSQLFAIDNSGFAGGLVGISYAGITFQTQTGSGNDVEAFQGGSAAEASNYSEQIQTGDGNDALVLQNVWNSAAGGNNYAKQNQVGNNNVAGLAQGGVNHKAHQRQFGDNNNAMSTQMGDHNLVNTYQGGNMNVANTAQAGQNNQILLVQKGGHSYSVSQNLLDGMPNGGNVADILQLGPNGNFATDGEDCVFDPQLDPTRPYNAPVVNIADPCPDC